MLNCVFEFVICRLLQVSLCSCGSQLRSAVWGLALWDVGREGVIISCISHVSHSDRQVMIYTVSKTLCNAAALPELGKLQESHLISHLHHVSGGSFGLVAFILIEDFALK